MRSLFLFLTLSPLAAIGCTGGPHEAHGPGAHGAHGSHDGAHSDHATVHHRFEDAEHWAKRFEDPGRDAWQRPEVVIDALDLTASSRVADIGAATGYFPVRIAPEVPEGVVYALDIEPTLVNYLNLRAHREGHTNLRALVCATDDPRIPEPVDVILICNTYHHIGDRVAYFRRLRSLLRPGGRLVIVDFGKGDFPVGPRDDHKLAAEQVIGELGESGFRLAERAELPYQYVLVFR